MKLVKIAATEPSLDIQILDITPAMAEKWLTKNHVSNRPLNWRWVEAMANDMTSGNWKLTHQGICFDKDGYLIDGQHRLSAVVLSKRTVKLMVTHNSDTDFHDPIDRGRVRSIGLLLGMRASAVAALNLLRMFETGIKLHTPQTTAEAQDAFEHHGILLSKVAQAGKNKLKSGELAACVWGMPVDHEGVLEFAQKVATGEMISRGDPAYALRSWREGNVRRNAWDMSMASLNCLRHHLCGSKLSNVYTGEMGYRAFVSRRRALKVAHTPGVTLVQGVSWMTSRGASSGEEG